MTDRVRSATLAGVGAMLLGVFLFSVNDAMGKWLVATYTVGQVLLVRSAAALVVLAPFVRREGRGVVAAERPVLQGLRVVLSTLEVALFYWAVAYLPLVDVMTYYLAAPIYVVALSALLLREAVGLARWAAVVAGFVGVAVALRPSAATLTAPALIAVAGSLCFAFLMLATRFLRASSGTALVTWQTAGALVAGLALAPFGWVTPSAVDLGLLMLLGVVAMLGHVCVTWSLKLAPASVVVPYQYTFIVWAVILGWLVFDHLPDWRTLLGALIIVVAGLALLRRDDAGRPASGA